MARVEINPDWRELVIADWTAFAEERLGPEVADDARKYCPVDTGALKASIRDDMEGEDLIVSATGGGEDRDSNLYVFNRLGKIPSNGSTHPYPGRNLGELRTREIHHVERPSAETGHPYALWVELGHRVFHPSTRVVGPEVVSPRPFLRPALYQKRGE